MEHFTWTALTTLIALILFFVMGVRVAGARHKFKIEPPAITGHAEFERHFRVQANTLEWLPIYLPSLWLCAVYWGDMLAAGIGAVWIVGRFLYMIGYVSSARSRGAGFLIQTLAALALLIGALAGVVQALIAAA